MARIKKFKELRIRNVKMISVQDWDGLVSSTYDKPYSFQQQEGCQSRGVFDLQIPSDWADEQEQDMHDEIPEIINGEVMGVKFQKWLERDPKEWNGKKEDQRFVDLWWDRNFYPSIHTVANDLYMKGLIEPGEYSIRIDW